MGIFVFVVSAIFFIAFYTKQLRFFGFGVCCAFCPVSLSVSAFRQKLNSAIRCGLVLYIYIFIYLFIHTRKIISFSHKRV